MGEDHFSPDGRFVVQLSCNEMRMSHWVCTPSIKAVAETKDLMDLYPTLWHADTVDWSPDSRTLDMDLRLYPGSGPAAHLTLHLDENQAIVERAGALHTLTIPEAEALFKQWDSAE